MKNVVLEDKKACEYILLDFPIKKIIKRAYAFLKETNFVDEFEKNTDKSSRIQALIGYHIDQKDILQKDIFNKIVYDKGVLHMLLTYNVSILFLLEHYFGEYDSVISFLCGEKLQESKVMKIINHHLEINCEADRAEYSLNLFLSLKWFYSDKTKHLYSEELLKEMEDYEKQVKNLDLKELEKNNPRFSSFRLRF
ncbi:MAG: hypothetical protein ABIE94_02330 [archaeon]